MQLPQVATILQDHIFSLVARKEMYGLEWNLITISVSKIRKIIYSQVRHTSRFWVLWPIHMFTGPLFQIKLHLLNTVLLSGFQSSPGAWNPLSKAISGNFNRSGRHSKHKYSQERANFHRSQSWQIVLIFNTATYICVLSPQKKNTVFRK